MSAARPCAETAAGATTSAHELRITRGAPDDVEVAALAVVLAALAAAPPPELAGPPTRWVARTAHLRRPLPVGPDAWRTSAWPA
jgi:hypothetical protein